MYFDVSCEIIMILFFLVNQSALLMICYAFMQNEHILIHLTIFSDELQIDPRMTGPASL